VRDLAATAAELTSRGVPVLRGPRREHWGLDEMWIADPDGLRIVLVESRRAIRCARTSGLDRDHTDAHRAPPRSWDH